MTVDALVTLDDDFAETRFAKRITSGGQIAGVADGPDDDPVERSVSRLRNSVGPKALFVQNIGESFCFAAS